MRKPKSSPEQLAAWRAAGRRYCARHRELIRQRAKQYAKDNPDKVRESQRKWRLRNMDRMRSLQRAWRDRNREKLKMLNETYHAGYRRKNRSRIYAAVSKWRKSNPEKCRHYQHTRRAVKLSNGVSEDAAKRIAFLRKNAGRVRCYWCGSKLNRKTLTIDHIVAIRNGGPHAADNLCASCRSCNSSKKDTPVSHWRKSGQQILDL